MRVCVQSLKPCSHRLDGKCDAATGEYKDCMHELFREQHRDAAEEATKMVEDYIKTRLGLPCQLIGSGTIVRFFGDTNVPTDVGPGSDTLAKYIFDACNAYPDLVRNMVRLESERDEARKALVDAAMAINCAGPVVHRIQILKKAHADHVDELQMTINRLVELTRLLDEHPEGYDGPCECKLCLSYVDCEGLDFDREEG